jgi:ribosomal protein S18 acetylase RimI-like enzyme
MSGISTLRLQLDTRGIDWTELAQLFKAADLGGREGDKIRRAFEKSTVVCFVFDDARLIGAARALSDLEYHATIYDVAVHPDYQRQGIGTRVMTELLRLLPVWRVLLVADADATPFYSRLGFAPFGEVLARFDQTKLFEPPRVSA